MSKEDRNKVCPVEIAGGLDNSIRRFLQNPRKILAPYIKPGMTVLDMGCGPGFFTVEMAGMLNGSGEVIAVDLQEGMLDKVRQKIRGTDLEKRIRLHQCSENGIGLSGKVDFILAFYMIHEVPDKERLFREMKSILNPGGTLFIIEPKFHVRKKPFDKMVDLVLSSGFGITGRPGIFFSRAVVFQNRD